MSDEYTFWHMLKDVIFNGNKVSGGKNDREEEQDISRDGYSGDFSSSRKSRDFNTTVYVKKFPRSQIADSIFRT